MATEGDMENDMDQCLDTYDYIFRPDILANKVVLITGGGSGIGFTVAEVLMRHQCKTIIASRNGERLQKATEKLRKATGQECIPIQMDVRKPKEILAGLDIAFSNFGKIDVLINGAAGNFLCPVSSMSFNAFKTVIEIDTMGTFNVSKCVFDRYMKKHGGIIINISATLPYRGTYLQAHSGSAKAAIDALTKHLAVDWGQYGIRVCGLAPGPIGDTEGVRRLGGGMEKSKEAVSVIPLQRMGTKREIADSVLYLISKAAAYLTGHTVVVDGGSWMTAPNGIATTAVYSKL